MSINGIIWIGFALLGLIFLLVLWLNKRALHGSYESYHELQQYVSEERLQTNAILYSIYNTRIYVSDFLQSHNLDSVNKALTLIEQALEKINTIYAADFSNKEEFDQLVEQIKLLQTAIHGTASAWVEKGLDHNSGLQGQFRNNAHQLEVMAQKLGLTEPQLAVRLEKELLTLRRREKDYLLRLDKKYVSWAYDSVKTLHSMVEALDDNLQLDNQKFRDLLKNYQAGFASLVTVNDRLETLKQGRSRVVNKMGLIIDKVIRNIDNKTMREMENVSKELEDHIGFMTLLTVVALIIGGGVVIYIVRLSSQQVKDVHQRETLFRSIMETAIEGIVTIDSKGIIHNINQAVGNIFGYPCHELVGKNIKILIPPPHDEHHDGYIESYLETGIKTIIGRTREVEGICRDGGVFSLELSVSDFIIDGETYFTGVLHDVTERKQAKEALKQAYAELERRVLERTQELENMTIKLGVEVEEHKRAQAGLILASKVFENASEAIIITDNKSNIVDVNPAFAEITGFSKEETLGKNPGFTKSGRHSVTFYAEMWKTILAEGRWSGEIWDRHKNGNIYPKWLTINAIKDCEGEISYFIGIFSDISHIKATEKRLEQLAFYDPLTMLPNRMLFHDRLTHEIEVAGRNKHFLAVCFIDLDRFKHVNDTLGHAAGDTLLVEVAKRIGNCVRKSDTVARLGGDEFTIILSNIEQPQQCATIAENIIHSLQRVFNLGEQEVFIGASIGIAMFPANGRDFSTLTKNADTAMYRAKDSGRGVYRFFESKLDSVSQQRLTREAHFRRAVDNQSFELFYQPKFKLTPQGNLLTGMESLVRWPQKDGTMISPGDFIPLAEETGLIEPLGEWILNEACHQTQQWNSTGLGSFRVAVNLSARQFRQKNIKKIIGNALEKSGLDPAYLELEVTESMVMDHSDKAAMVLHGLREMGLTIALDDFGTGYSSLSYLKQFPIHALKIDQSFVRNLVADSDDAAIVKAIISLAHDLGLKVVAEGVETEAQLSFLKEKNCDEVQGYLLSKPLSATSFELLTNSYRSWNS